MSKIQFDCLGKSYVVFKMGYTEESVFGMGKKSFILESSRRKISFPNICVEIVMEEYPSWNGDPDKDTRIDVQKEYTEILEPAKK